MFQAIDPSGHTLLGGGRSKLYDGVGLSVIVMGPFPQPRSSADKAIAATHIPKCLVAVTHGLHPKEGRSQA